MEIKRFGNIEGKTMMLLHGNLMCWRQFEDLIPLLERKFCVYAVSFDGRRISWLLILKKSLTDSWICFLQSRWAADRLFF